MNALGKFSEINAARRSVLTSINEIFNHIKLF